METKINERKMKNFLQKFEGAEYNNDNYSVGGGLASGTGMSNRNFDAKYDSGKLTLDQAGKKIADIFGIDKSIVVSIIDHEFDLEWHHAGFLPKSYGGGMRKIYYVNADQMIHVVRNFSELLNKKIVRDEEKNQAEISRKNQELARAEFAEKFGKKFSRVTTLPKFYVETDREMQGKYGWFSSYGKSYNLTEYISGIEFESQEMVDKYRALKA